MAQDLRGGGLVLAAPSPPTPPPASIDWTVQETRKKLNDNVDEWIVEMKSKLFDLEQREERAPKQYAVESIRKPHGVEPELFGTRGNNQYNWTMEGANVLTLEEYTALWKRDLTVDAYLRANGYCFTYAVGKAIDLPYKTVRAKVKEAMEYLLKEGRDRFRGWCSTFLNERRAKFCYWFAEKASIAKGHDEDDESFFSRVLIERENAERASSKPLWYYLVRFIQYNMNEFATTVDLKSFTHAFPEWGLRVVMIVPTGLEGLEVRNWLISPEPKEKQPSKGFKTLLLHKDHFFLLRAIDKYDNEPTQPLRRGRPRKDSAPQRPEEQIPQDIEKGLASDDDVIEVDDSEAAIAKKESRVKQPLQKPFQFTEDDLVNLKNNFQDFLKCVHSNYVRGGTSITTLMSFFRKKYRPQSDSAANEMSTVRQCVAMAGAALTTDTTEFIRNLSKGQWICTPCRGEGVQAGSPLVLNVQTVTSHLASKKHVFEAGKRTKNDNIKKYLASQSKTAANLTSTQLIQAALTADFIAHGVPPYQVPLLLSARNLELIRALDSGLHSVKASNETVLPTATEVIRDYIQHDLKDMPFSIITDSVMTRIDGGKDVLLVYASSPALVDKLKSGSASDIDHTGEILLGEHHYISGFTADKQSDAIKEILRTSGINLDNAMWLGGDNAFKNVASARDGLKIPFANCLAHSLNLVLKEFMNNFAVTQCIGLPSQFVRLGNSLLRCQLLKLFALQITRLDYSNTRWQGKLEALIYLVDNLTDKQYALWNKNKENDAVVLKRLQTQVHKSTLRILSLEKKEEEKFKTTVSSSAPLSMTASSSTEKVTTDSIDNDDNGNDDDDDSPLEGVEDVPSENHREGWAHLNHPTVWTQLYHFVLASDTATKLALKTMAFLSDWKLFTEALLIKECLGDLPSLISKTEGGNSYMTGEKLDTIIRDTTFMMNKLRTYKDNDQERKNVVDSVIKQAKEVARKHFQSTEYAILTEKKQQLIRHERESGQQGVLALLDSYSNHLRTQLKAACSAVLSVNDENQVVNNHVDEAIKRLKLRRVFSLSTPLPNLDTEDGREAAIVRFLRPLLPTVFVSAHDKRSKTTPVETLAQPFSSPVVQRALYVAYEKLVHIVNGNDTQPSVIGKVENPLKYFQDLVVDNDPGTQQLARLAVRALVAPVTSVAAERGGSILRKLGDPDRRNMGDTAVTNNMFFQNNRVYVDRLGTAAVNRCRSTAPKGNTASNDVIEIDEGDGIDNEHRRRKKAQQVRTQHQQRQQGSKAITQIPGQSSLKDFMVKKKGNNGEDGDINQEEEDEEEKGGAEGEEEEEAKEYEAEEEHEEEEEDEMEEDVEPVESRTQVSRRLPKLSTSAQKSSSSRQSKKRRVDPQSSSSSSSRSSKTKIMSSTRRKMSKKRGRGRKIESSDDDDTNDDDNHDQEDDDEEDNKDDDDDDS